MVTLIILTGVLDIPILKRAQLPCHWEFLNGYFPVVLTSSYISSPLSLPFLHPLPSPLQLPPNSCSFLVQNDLAINLICCHLLNLCLTYYTERGFSVPWH